MSTQLRLVPTTAGERSAAADPHAPVVVVGEVVYVVFSSAESGFRVLRVKDDATGKSATVAGRTSPIRVGDRVRAVGRWKQSKHGLQLDAESVVALDAVTSDGLARSLDGLVYGLGPARARRLVESLGGAEGAVSVLDAVCSSMLSPASIAPAAAPSQTSLLDDLDEAGRPIAQPAEESRAEAPDVAEARRIVSDSNTLIGAQSWLPLQVRVDVVLAWRRSRVEREVEARLASLQLPPSLRARLVARYGGDAARVAIEEPYRLTLEIEGVGFLTADDVALKVGVGVDSLERVDAAVAHVLREQSEDGGHTVCAAPDLTKAMFQLFMQRRPPAPLVDRGAACVEEAVERLVEDGHVLRVEGGVALPHLAQAERTIAARLLALLSAERRPLEFAGSIDPSLTEEQRLAVRSVFERGVGIVTGGPGCGKTHACREIVRVARSLGLRVALCAPTARAAKRLSEMTESAEAATTIHRLLEARGSGQFLRNAGNQIDADLVLVDECFDYKQPILTENGWEYIGTVVNAKKKVRVWSRNPVTGRLELKKIKRWLKRDAPKDGMLRISAGRSGAETRRGTRVIRCTADHKILTSDGYKRAGDLRVGDALVVKGSALTSNQRSVLVGSMLGDGSMVRQRSRNSPQPVLMNGEAQIDYLEFKRTVFGDLAGPLQEGKSGYCDRVVWRFTVAATDDSTRIADEMVFSGKHPSGRRRWSPTDSFLEMIDPMALAVWYMDNGSTSRSRYANLHTERFSLSDHLKFVAWFKRRYGLVVKVRESRRGYFWLSFGAGESAKLFDLIREFIPRCMKWKVPGAKNFKPRRERQPETCLAEVKSIQPHKPNRGHRRFVYDIEVADNHNYIAGNIVVSNCSMTDVSLMAALVSAVRPDARLLLVGDADQLPPVGPGAPFRDAIASGAVPVARLTKIHRQAVGSAIVRVAHGVLRGATPTPSPDGDRADGCVHLVRKPVPEQAAQVVVQIVLGLQEELGVDPWEALVLAPMRKGACGVAALNAMLQQAMNPPRADLPEFGYGKDEARRTYRRGDRVRQTKNDYERGVVNGDVGRIVEVYPERDRPRGGAWLDVDFPGVGVVHYDGQQLNHLVLAYCNTIHSCVSPDTIVETDLGLMRIEDIPIERPSYVGTPTGKKTYENFVENDESDVLSIQTNDGYSLNVTPEHGMDVWNPESSRYERKVAEEIVDGDWLRMRLGTVVEPTAPTRLPDAPETDVRAVRFSFPTHLTEEVAEFLGLMVADGTVYKRGFRLLKRHEDVVERFAHLVATIFGAVPRKLSAASVAHYSSPVFAYEVNSTQVATWLLSLGGLHPRKKGVPVCVLRSSSAVQAAFLRGLFEDGTVNVKNEQLDHVELLTSMPELASLVRIMLLRLGIASSTRITTSRGRDYHRVYVYGIFAKRFAEKVGFISKFKSDRLEYPIGRSGHVIPVGKIELEKLARAEGKDPHVFLTNTEKNCLYRGQISRATLDGLLARSTEKTDAWRDLRERADLFHHVRVERVEWRRGRSMCVSVPDGERFLQNGFCGWNSQGGESPAVVLALVDQHYVMLTRTLLYTAVTRAKRACLIVGSSRALETAARNARDDARRTTLVRLLREGLDATTGGG